MIDAKRFKDELSALLDQLYESQNGSGMYR